MQSAPQERLDRIQPVLVVKQGTARKRYVSVNRPATTIGRARGCDFQVDAEDVSAIHCIVTFGAGGLQVRDCASRLGTQVNGNAVRQAALHDTDMLQIGSITFQVFWPNMASQQNGAGAAAGEARLSHLEHSRRHLAGLALGLRRQLRGQPAGPKSPKATRILPLLDLDRVARARPATEGPPEVGLKSKEVDLAQLQLAAWRDALLSERADLQLRVGQFEQEMARRRAQIEGDIQARLRQCEQRCREMEQAHAEENHRLEIRRQELECYARHLRQEKEGLEEEEEQFKLVQDQLGFDFPESIDEPVAAICRSARPGNTAQPQADLQELARAMTELKSLQQGTMTQQQAELEALRQTTRELQQLLGECFRRPGEPVMGSSCPVCPTGGVG